MVDAHRRLVRRQVMEEQARAHSSSAGAAPAAEPSAGLEVPL
jgi:hypothetical protein